MSKSVGALLLVVGLGIGLFLGFNPKAHQEVVQTWHQASTSMVRTQSHVAVKPPTVKLPTVTAKPSTQPSVSLSALWKQITLAFETLWHSVQRAWVSITASIRTTR